MVPEIKLKFIFLLYYLIYYYD
uniref:Uncharacterized protein n=1 Tax=Moumouvirus sp. 'Monve' TaxID=1128131 RepID=H2EDD5_9VIRU|nr:hypothetical protein mv_L203 [Moumouvirus Monve]